ncbi:uncharacterized protein EI90DRAFT_3027167 [Cantharellus anzutake]|uniref:uncharacterized protein n=1 Tax=Cantharellus anzutake TaxID=1750568 RepID=UPI001902D6B9|nr:uncharacterized protein EI90DRAFT_3027167 [Cantharellus anzutake]KAF8343807.1 hypothetical protein EI90DRAFT_3027167 [Cantharellus anzutake]
MGATHSNGTAPTTFSPILIAALNETPVSAQPLKNFIGDIVDHRCLISCNFCVGRREYCTRNG